MLRIFYPFVTRDSECAAKTLEKRKSAFSITKYGRAHVMFCA
jgi:hypothetical protein